MFKSPIKTILTCLSLVLVAGFISFTVTSCSLDTGSGKSSQQKDKEATEKGLSRQQQSQPVPIYDWSQFRETLIEITDAKANTTQTTSFFFLEGVGLVFSCPSIGFPVPSTAQLTNPEVEKGPRESRITLPQAEPTGVFTGDSTGTYTICIDAEGRAYASYWEGYVQTVSGPAKFEDDKVVLSGKPTGDFSKGK